MDRRSFLQSVGVAAAGTAAISSDSFASAPAAGGLPSQSPQLSQSPQFLSNSDRDRQQIVSTDLSPWTPSTSQPWDVHTINHLYRRAGFGATLAEIKAASGKSFSSVVDALLDDTLLMRPTVPVLPGNADDGKTPSLPPAWLRVPPYVYNNPIQQQNDYYTAQMKIRSHWTAQMDLPEVMLREKMTLFWMNHFVIEAKKVVWPQATYNFLTYMRQNAWGNFKKMVSDVTIMPAMLYYLDGVLNVGQAPNENYARELQELFTMGVVDKDGKANYTQSDVEGIAHALTGWTVDYQSPPPNILPALYNIDLHNTSKQTIYDTTPRIYNLKASGASMDMDLIDHIFDQRGDKIAWYICSKLYQYFVYHDISQKGERDVIDAMAALFKASNWELKPVISALLKSAHFFDEANIGAEIKSPFEHLIGLLRTFDIQIDELAAGTLYYYAAGGSQILLDPPNVKGWPGYHNWISTTTLPYRDIIQTALVGGSLPTLGGSDGYSNALPSIDLPDVMITAWGKQLTNYNGTFDGIVKEIATYLCAQRPSDYVLNRYIEKSNLFPPNVYEWASLSDQEKVTPLRILATTISLFADFQLT